MSDFFIQIRDAMLDDFRRRDWKCRVAWPDPEYGCLKSRRCSTAVPGILVTIGPVTFCVVFNVDQIELLTLKDALPNEVYLDNRKRICSPSVWFEELIISAEYADPQIIDRIIAALTACHTAAKEEHVC